MAIGVMRVLLWNCNNGLSKQSQLSYFHSFAPDLAIIPELKQDNINLLSPSSSIWVTNNHNNSRPKGLRVLGFNNVTLTKLPADDEMEIFLPINVQFKNHSFSLLAVWNFYWASKQGRFKGLKGEDALEYSALRHYLPLLKQPLLIAGDWNLGPTFAQDAFLKICSMVEEYGLKSLYHQIYDLDESETQHNTFKSTRKTFHHLDQVFGCFFFQQAIQSIEIPDFDEVVLSDHAPVCSVFKF